MKDEYLVMRFFVLGGEELGPATNKAEDAKPYSAKPQ